MSDETEPLPPEATEPEPMPEPAPLEVAQSEPPPVVDTDALLATALETIGRLMADSNRRIVRDQIKVDGVWYSIEVARP
jgi:hypothetical protein